MAVETIHRIEHLPSVTDATFERAVLASARPVLVDFTDSTCGQCRSMELVAERLAAEYAGRVDVVKVVAAQSPRVTERYGVMGLPVFVLVVRGQEVARLPGLPSRAELRRAVDQALDERAAGRHRWHAHAAPARP